MTGDRAVRRPDRTAALLIVDVQQAIDAPYWSSLGPRNNPQAELAMAAVLAAWRRHGLMAIHIRHDSTDPKSAYRPGMPGHAFKQAVAPLPGEIVVPKCTNSAFIGTDLEGRLRKAGIRRLVVMGVITNNSVESTVRMAGNLGFETELLADACFTFPRRDFDGVLRSAAEVHAMSLANMDGEYARVIGSAVLLAAF